jgi:hypothetical protein
MFFPTVATAVLGPKKERKRSLSGSCGSHEREERPVWLVKVRREAASMTSHSCGSGRWLRDRFALCL